MVCVLLHVIAMVWLLWSQDLWMFYLWALVFGLAWGGTGPTMAALIGDTFGLGRIGAILGLLEVGFGAGAGLGPIIGGVIFDLKQSYFLAFLLGVVVMLVTTVLISFIRREWGKTVASG